MMKPSKSISSRFCSLSSSGAGDIRIVESLCSLGRHLSLGEIDQIFNAREHSISKANYMV